MNREARRRRRPALSCLDCRRRKIKCDRNDPCAHCVTANTQCTYKTYRDGPVVQEPLQTRVRARSQGSISSPSANVASLFSPSATALHNNVATPITVYEGNSSGRGLTAVAATQSGASNNPGLVNLQPSINAQDTAPGPEGLQDLLQRIQKLEQSSASNLVQGLSETGREIFTRQAGLQESKIILNKTRMLGWSHWMSTTPEFESLFGFYSKAYGNDEEALPQEPELRALVVQIGDLLRKCKEIARSIKTGRPSRSLSGPGFGLEPPTREIADDMVKLYFQSFESTHRILHIPSFWVEYQRYWDQRETVPTAQRLKILLVIGIGSSLSQNGEDDPGFRKMVHHWVYAAQTWLAGPMEKDRLNITGLQIHCLIILARQIFSIGGDLMWMSMGSLLHSAMQMGMHRDPKHLPAMSILQAEIRKRLWATILEMAIQSSLDSAMPPRISFEEFDTGTPSNVNDSELDDSTTSLQPHPQGTFTTSSLQILLLSSAPTRLRFLQLLNGLRSEISYLDTLALSSQISDVYRTCAQFLKEHEAAGVTAFHRNLFDYLVRRFLIPLHAPFASQARKNPLFYYSLKVSLDVSMAIIKPEPDAGFTRLMSISGGMFREGMRYATAAISLEILAQVEAERLDGTLYRKSQYRELLKQAVRDMIELSAERIRQGETNIKGHTFLSMILAQVEAMEAGIPGEYKVAQSGKASVEFCHELLLARAETFSLQDTPGDTGSTTAGLDHGPDGYGWDLEVFFTDIGFS